MFINRLPPYTGDKFGHPFNHVLGSGSRERYCAGLLRRFPSTLKSSIAILTPYKSQVAELRYAMSAALSKSQMQNVEAATVDGFQVLVVSPILHQQNALVVVRPRQRQDLCKTPFMSFLRAKLLPCLSSRISPADLHQ